MSEPNLILQYDALRTEIALELGYGTTSANWSAAQIAQISRMLNNGYRRFLWPDILPGERVPHQWTFLHPVTTIQLWPTTTGAITGVPSYSDPASTITLATGTAYPLMVGKSFVFGTSGNSYTIASYVSASQITVTGDASAEASGDTYTITADGDYTLPDDFGNIVGNMYMMESDTINYQISQRNVADILARRAADAQEDSPLLVAIAPKSMTGATTGQRQQAMFFPTPDAAYEVTYRYSILPSAITETYTFPRGIEAHTETLRFAVLAACDRFRRTDSGYEMDFMRALRTSVMLDRMADSPDNMGYNGDQSVAREQMPIILRNSLATVTYNGIEV